MKMEFDFTKLAPHYNSLTEANSCIEALWLNSRLLQKEIEELQEKLNLNPTNSSLPPSTQPTYNRKKKFWRKLSFGTQSERGNRFIESMMTVTATCKQQQRNALEFITEVIESTLASQHHR